MAREQEWCTECYLSQGFVVTAWERECGGWDIAETRPCHACRCFDCGTPAGVYETAVRDGKPEIVCVECAVESGDDNYNSCLAHDREAGR